MNKKKFSSEIFARDYTVFILDVDNNKPCSVHFVSMFPQYAVNFHDDLIDAIEDKYGLGFNFEILEIEQGFSSAL